MKKEFIFLRSIILLILGFAACHKPNKTNNSAPTPATYTGCRVSQITKTGGVGGLNPYAYVFSYNNNGTVSKININTGPVAEDNSEIDMVYGNNYILAETMYGGDIYTTDSLTLDGQNRVTNIFQYGDNEFPSSTNYQYDSLGNLVLITSYNNNHIAIGTANYQWENGDLEWFTSGTDYYTYTYSSGLYNTGNINAHITDLETYGRGIYTPKHLPLYAVSDNTDTTYYVYSMDNQGKITSLVVNPNSFPETTTITYTCE